jgi:pimeloyl-ACP methyl ester carboxylesterase
LQDLELVKILIRTGSLFLEDLSEAENFSKERYGSVPRACIVSNDDLAIPIEYQEWMIQNAGIDEVKLINGADHMVMLSKPQELCLSLVEMADKYA